MFTNNCVGIRLLLGLVILFVAVNMNTHLAAILNLTERVMAE
jgi:hypothetical protein